MRQWMFSCFRAVNAMLPEGDWKNNLRAYFLAYRNALPRELMIRRGETVVQVGMWRPHHVERLARGVGPGGRVIVVEADPTAAANIRAHVEKSGFTNVTVVNKGAWHEKGEMKFLLAESTANNRLDVDNVNMLGEMGKNVFQREKVIPVDTLDGILAEQGVQHVDYLEVTVNGVELEVLRGGARILSRTRRAFIAGYSRSKDTNEANNRHTAAFLGERGFRTKITRKSPPRQADFDPQAAKEWGLQEGHVFAWRGKKAA